MTKGLWWPIMYVCTCVWEAANWVAALWDNFIIVSQDGCILEGSFKPYDHPVDVDDAHNDCQLVKLFEKAARVWSNMFDFASFSIMFDLI